MEYFYPRPASLIGEQNVRERGPNHNARAPGTLCPAQSQIAGDRYQARHYDCVAAGYRIAEFGEEQEAGGRDQSETGVGLHR